MIRKEKTREVIEYYDLLSRFDQSVVLWYLRWREWSASYMNAHWVNPPNSLLVMFSYFLKRHK